MVGQIDISADGASITIRFPYREDLVNLVRDLKGRRWDRSARVWRVPIEEVEAAVKLFMPYGFSLAPEVATALATGGKDKNLGTIQVSEIEQKSDSLSVSALNFRVAEHLRGKFTEPIWVVGELANFDKKSRSRHRYFELVERDPEEEEARPRAVVSAVIFEKAMTIIRRRLARYGDAIQLADGVKVRVRGKVDLFEARGRYQFLIDDLDPSYTVGEQVLRQEKILQALKKEKLLEKNKALPLPLVPLRIALLTSFESDAYNDFIQTLAAQDFAFEVTVYDCFVQGDRLKSTVTNGLQFFAEDAENYDLLVITRGGGSRTELGSWDDLDIARAVATHPLKAVIAIGHERDQSVLDALALSVKTPTAAGELVVERVRAYQEKIEDSFLEICDQAETILREAKRGLRDKARGLANLVRGGIAGQRAHLAGAQRRLGRAVTERFQREELKRVQKTRDLLHQTSRLLNQTENKLLLQETKLKAYDPKSVLKRGYAWLRNKDGKTIHSVQQVKKGDLLDATLADGHLPLKAENPSEDFK
ncbi:MAG TPA: exodeoxyribonuclease VII large subunit [Planctomycetes bacterium]|nr:exodeoxyribonuclease VII large subunit [Planctomycetota bacterium]